MKKVFIKISIILLLVINLVSCTDNTENLVETETTVKSLNVDNLFYTDPNDDGTEEPDDEE